MHRRKSSTLQREEALGNNLGEFYNLPNFAQMENVIETAKKIGSIDKVVAKANSLSL